MDNKPQSNENNQDRKKHLTSAERQELYKARAAQTKSKRISEEKKKKILKITLMSVTGATITALIVILIMLNAMIWTPNHKYRNAEKFADEGEYLKAYDAFTALGDYKDASDRAWECIIANAKALSGRDEVIIGFASDMPWFSIEDGDISFNSEVYIGDGNIVIPDVFENRLVTGIAGKAFQGGTFLKSVVIPSSVRTIGEYAFSNCPLLVSVTIPDSVEVLGEKCFNLCSALETVTFGSGLKTIGMRAFRDCYALKSAVIPEGVEEIGVRAFNCCTAMTDVTLPSTLTRIGSDAFTECTSLKTVTFNGTKAELEALCAEDEEKTLLKCDYLITK